MTQFPQPNLLAEEILTVPFTRDGADKLVRRSYWLDMKNDHRCSSW